MKKNRASETAGYTTAMRAIANLAPTSEKILTDPFAVEFLAFPWSLTQPLFRLKIFNHLIFKAGMKTPDLMVGFPGMTALACLRHRYIDDQIIAAYEQGIRQFIILGAGYDARALRLPLPDAHFIEIDHANTQSRKQNIIARKKLQGSGKISFIPCDFSTSWADNLFNHPEHKDFISQQAAMVIWEGVSCYLKPEAVAYTFKTVKNMLSPGSIFIFDAFPKDIINPNTTNSLLKKMQDFVARKGEPFYWGEDLDKLKKTLSALGFAEIRAQTIFEIGNALAEKEQLTIKSTEILNYLHMLKCHT